MSSIPPKELKVYYFKDCNFGDILTPYILKQLFGVQAIYARPRYCQLMGIGSILNDLRVAPPNVTVWGSGFIKSGPRLKLTQQTILAVRGKLSAGRLLNCGPVALGDPGLLVNRVYRPQSKKYLMGFVPHYVDFENPITERIRSLEGVHEVCVRQMPEPFMAELSQCECIVSSSLHGCIAAESFGIPYVHVQLSDKVIGDNYKFRDYYSVFNAEHHYLDLRQIALQEIDLKMLQDAVAQHYVRPENLDQLEDELIRVFEEWINR